MTGGQDSDSGPPWRASLDDSAAETNSDEWKIVPGNPSATLGNGGTQPPGETAPPPFDPVAEAGTDGTGQAPPDSTPGPPAAPAAPAKKKDQGGTWVVVAVLVIGAWWVLGQGFGGLFAEPMNRPPVSPGYQEPVFTDGVAQLHYAWTYGGEEWTWEPELPYEVYDYYRSLDRATYVNEYDRFVTDPTDDALIEAIAAKIREAAAAKGYSEFETLSFALAFVQSLPYAFDDTSAGFDEYPRYPVETLVDDGSDCEDTSILYASLVLKLGYSAVLLAPPGHMAVGVAGSDVPGTYVEYQGTRYYYAETTGDGWEIGETPPQYQHSQMLVYELGPPAPMPSTTTTQPSTTTQPAPSSPTPSPTPTQHYLDRDEPVAIPAGSYYWRGFTVNGSLRVDYTFTVVDDSSVDIGIIRHSDMEAYGNGESVPAWAYHSNVQDASDSVILDTDTYDLVIRCQNAYFNCDGEYSLSTWY